MVVWHFLQDGKVMLLGKFQMSFVFDPDSFTELIDFGQQTVPQLFKSLIVHAYILLLLWVEV